MQRILVAIDLSQASRRALRTALELSRAFKAPLRVIHVLSEESSDADKALKDFILEELQGDAKDFKRIDRKVIQGSGAKEILEEAAWWQATLVVIGSRGHSALKRFLLGSVSSRVLSRATMPVLVVRGTGEARPRKILAAVDGGARTADVLRAALSWSQTFEAPLDVVHVMPVLSEPTVHRIFPDSDLRPAVKNLMQQIERDVEKLVRRVLPQDLRPAIEYRVGSPAEEICASIEEGGHDLVIVGVHEKQGALDLANTAARVAQSCAGSILVVRPMLMEGWELEPEDEAL